MSGRTSVVYFYMIGCPHCEAMRPAWEDAKKKLKSVTVREKEANDVDPMEGVQSFPTIIVYKNGKETKRIQGSRGKGGQILSELGLLWGRSNRRRTHRGKRKVRHRTLRNYKSFA